MKTATAPEKKKQASSNVETRTVFIGFDLGTNMSCVKAVDAAERETIQTQRIPTTVGYAREGLVEGILPENRSVLFGEEALKHRMHLDLVAPLRAGMIHEDKAAAAFMQHAREVIGLKDTDEARAVIGIPARTDAEGRERVRRAVKGVFQKVILIPEPFLAALGYREDKKVGSASYTDPVKNSLFIDIGAGSTDLCLVQGYYPSAEDQVGIAFAGDAIDESIANRIFQKYPDSDLSRAKIRALKEQHSHVGATESITVTCIIGGKPRQLEVGEAIREACTELLERIFQGLCHLIAMAEPDSVPELLNNIVLTGGGCQIRNLASELQRRLEEEGFAQPVVKVAGENYKDFVARGALKAALTAREDQWQTLIR